MPDEIRIGVAGAGVFGGHHAGKYASEPRAVLQGVFDANRRASEALAAKYSCKIFDDYATLLQKVDAVVLTTPAVDHAAMTAQAIAAGKHVFVEKPLALTGREATALVAAARNADVILQVGHQERYVLAATGLLECGEKLVSATCRRSSRPSERCRDVSAVFDLMIHDIDIIRQLTNASPTHINAEGDYDNIRAKATLADGAQIVFDCRRGAAAVERSIEFEFESGRVEFDFVNRKLINSSAAALEDIFKSSDDIVLNDPLAYGAKLFLDAISGQDAPYVSGASVVGAVDWAEQIDRGLSDRVERVREKVAL